MLSVVLGILFRLNQIWYLDPENWQMLCKVMYDRQGKFWKYLEYPYNEFVGYKGEKVVLYTAEMPIDIVRYHASCGWRKPLEVGKLYPRDYFLCRIRIKRVISF